MNISAAYAHALGDLFQSVGVCIAGAIIWRYPYPDYPMVQLSDPLATFLFSILVLNSTRTIVSDSVRILMQSAPADVDTAQLSSGLKKLDGVLGVHHLHVWSINAHEVSLSVHVMVAREQEMNQVLKKVQHYLRQKSLTHNTIQIEVVSNQFCDGKCGRKGEMKNSCCEGYDESCNRDSFEGLCYSYD